jgi:hypothetical protein
MLSTEKYEAFKERFNQYGDCIASEVSFEAFFKDGDVRAVAMLVECSNCGEKHIVELFTDGTKEMEMIKRQMADDTPCEDDYAPNEHFEALSRISKKKFADDGEWESQYREYYSRRSKVTPHKITGSGEKL